MIFFKDIVLRKAKNNELGELYNLETQNIEWTKFNGPYFGYKKPSLEEYNHSKFRKLQLGKTHLVVEHNKVIVGIVSYYWECEDTRWLEAGIVIYNNSFWGMKLGKKAMIAWVSNLFESLNNIERIGLTTWSGNKRMMKCAESIGFHLEGRIRKVRYYNGVYYDSMKYGVLREEWAKYKYNVFS